MNKKGAWGDLKNIILALVFGIILLLFTLYLSGGLSDAGSKAACKNWVNMQSSAKLGGIELSPLKSPCITNEETIKDSDKDKIYEQLARSMYDCWDIYGEGKKDFYSDWDWFGSDRHCRICSEIKVDEKVTKKRSSMDIDDFEIYLSNHNPPNHEETYAEYFLGAENAKIDFGSGEFPLDSDVPLYTIFVVNKHRQAQEPLSWDTVIEGSFCIGAGKIGATIGAFTPVTPVGGAMIGCGVGLLGGLFVSVAGHADVLYPSLFLVPNKEIIDKGCDNIYYNPQKKLFEGFGEGKSGGAGAGKGY